MQIDMASLTPEAHQAIVECLKIAARRGRLLRETRERAAQAQNGQNTIPADGRAVVMQGDTSNECQPPTSH